MNWGHCVKATCKNDQPHTGCYRCNELHWPGFLWPPCRVLCFPSTVKNRIVLAWWGAYSCAEKQNLGAGAARSMPQAGWGALSAGLVAAWLSLHLCPAIPALSVCGISSSEATLLSLFKTDLFPDLPTTELVLFHVGPEWPGGVRARTLTGGIGEQRVPARTFRGKRSQRGQRLHLLYESQTKASILLQ